jgi:hypothetical protein
MPLALVLIATFALAGCTAAGPSNGAGIPSDGESTDAPDAVSTPLAAALAQMPVADGEQVSLGFSDVHRAAQLGVYESGASPFSSAGLFGFGSLGPYFLMLEGILPDDALENARASSGGIAPDGVVRFDGVADPGAALAEVSGERSELAGGTLIVRRDDYEIDFNESDFPGQVLANLNVIWFDDDTIITGTARANVERWVAPGAQTAASSFPGLAACLGDAIGATIVSADAARTSGDIGIAIAAAESEGGGETTAVQTLCVRSDNPGSAVDRITETIANGTDPLRGLPWSELLGAATVDDAGAGWVRVSSADARPNALVSVLQQGGLGALVD